MAWTTPRDWTGGEFVTEAMMDTHVRDNFLSMGPHLLARKTADETVTSSQTPQNDNHLIVPVTGTDVWQLHWLVMYGAPTAEDIRIGFNFPAGGDLRGSVIGKNSSAILFQFYNASSSPAGSNILDGEGAGTRVLVEICLIYANGGTGGNVNMEWAQGTSGGTGTIVYTNSTVWGVKLA